MHNPFTQALRRFGSVPCHLDKPADFGFGQVFAGAQQFRAGLEPDQS
jgi:hypothetical protein